MAVSLETLVTTPYGVGKVVAFRDSDKLYNVALTNWELSEGQTVHIFLPEENFTIAADSAVEQPVDAAAAPEAAPETAPEVVAVEEVVVKQEEAPVEEAAAVEEKKEEAAVEDKKEEVVAEEPAVVEEEKKEEVVVVEEPAAAVEEKKEEVAVVEEPAVAVEEPVAVEEAVDPNAPVAVDTAVTTAYGTGKITAYREEDAIYTVQLTNWFLSDNQKVHIYCQRDAFTLADSAEDVVALEAEEVATPAVQRVKTAYGEGVVSQYREEDGIYVVVLTNWVLSDNQQVRIYCQKESLEFLAEELPEKPVGQPTEESESKCCVIM